MATRPKPEAWGHDALASDLAAHLAGNTRERMIWENMQLGPSGSIRPDVYAIECSYSRFVATAYEVKVTRSDFLSDTTAGKALGYLKFANRLIYAVPAGLVELAEIPNGCGLIVRNPGGGWRHLRKPKVSPLDTLPRDAWMKLLIDGCARERRSARKDPAPRRESAWTHERRVRKMCGDELANMLQRRQHAEYRLAEATKKLEEERAETEGKARALAELRIQAEREVLADVQAQLLEFGRSLGMEDQSINGWSVRKHLAQMRPEADAQRLADAAQMLERHATWGMEAAAKIRAAGGVDPSPAT